MLILTRREGEAVVLETSDGPIEVSIVNIKGKQIRIGFDAPKSVEIARKELAEPAESVEPD